MMDKNRYIFNIDTTDGEPHLEAVSINGHFEICLVKESEIAIRQLLNKHGGDLYRYMVRDNNYDKWFSVSATMKDAIAGWLISGISISCENKKEGRREVLQIYGEYLINLKEIDNE